MNREKPKILVGTSLEPSSDPIVVAGAAIARGLEAELHLFHAYALPVAYFAGPTGMTTISPNLLDTELQIRQKLLDEQLERVELAVDHIAGTVLEPGAPHRMLLETAEELEPDLIVVGASETPGRLLQGTTADRVLRKATCPVWVVRESSNLPPRRILAPVDLSPLSEECLRRGLEIVDQWQGGPLDIEALFVLTHDEIESSSQFTPEQIERLATGELDSFCIRLGRDKAMRQKVRVGEIREEILDEIGAAPTDLVVIGSHGRSGFERFLLGSVASDISNRAPCSVLVIPPREAEA